MYTTIPQDQVGPIASQPMRQFGSPMRSFDGAFNGQESLWPQIYLAIKCKHTLGVSIKI